MNGPIGLAPLRTAVYSDDVVAGLDHDAACAGRGLTRGTPHVEGVDLLHTRGRGVWDTQ